MNYVRREAPLAGDEITDGLKAPCVGKMLVRPVGEEHEKSKQCVGLAADAEKPFIYPGPGWLSLYVKSVYFIY